MSDLKIDINGGISLIQNKNGLTFGTDALLLSAFTKRSKYMSSTYKAADLGSGTGIISLLCEKKERFNKVYAIEVQEDFCRIISENAKNNDLTDKIIPIHSNVKDVSPTMTDGEVDVVFSNPPYMKDNSGKRNIHDEKYIARHEVCGNIDDFCACAKRILKHGGKFLCVWRPDRLTDLIFAMRKNGIEPKTMVNVSAHPKADPSMVLIEGIKGGSSGMKVPRCLFLSDTKDDSINNIPSYDAKKIYESLSFEDFLES